MSQDTQLLREILAELRRLNRQQSAAGGPLTVEEAAEALGCGSTKVYALLKAGDLKRARRVGRCTMVTRESVDAFRASLTGKESKRPAAPWEPVRREDVGL